jgi:hypothetical protein
MLPVVAETAARFGFANSPVGTHSSKTMMLRDLSLLLDASPEDASYAELRRLAVEENVILKSTLSNRKEVFSRLNRATRRVQLCRCPRKRRSAQG